MAAQLLQEDGLAAAWSRGRLAASSGCRSAREGSGRLRSGRAAPLGLRVRLLAGAAASRPGATRLGVQVGNQGHPRTQAGLVSRTDMTPLSC